MSQPSKSFVHAAYSTNVGEYQEVGTGPGVVLDRIIIGTGGDCTIEVWDARVPQPHNALAVIRNPPSGTVIPFNYVAEAGIRFRLDSYSGPTSVTFLYTDPH